MFCANLRTETAWVILLVLIVSNVMNLNFLLLQRCANRNKIGHFVELEGNGTEFFATDVYTETKQIILLNLKKYKTITAVTVKFVI